MPSEYECALEQRDCRGALRFARELWNRQFVLKHVAPQVLARSSSHAALHRGHVVVSVDGVAVAGLSMRRFTELWVPGTGTSTGTASAAAASSTTRMVRFCDRRRAELETALRKDLLSSIERTTTTTTTANGSDHQQYECTQRNATERIAQCQALMWTHRLQDAEQELYTLLLDHNAVEPLLLVTRLEVVLIRVLVSNDALVVKRARQTAKQTLVWLQSVSELPSLSLASALSVRMALAEALLLSTALQFIAEKNVQGIAEFRRCTAMYTELQCDLSGETANALDAASTMPADMREDLQTRLCFGLGMLQLASASALQGPEWLRTVFGSVIGAPAHALDNLLRVSGAPNLRSAWATLALFHSASAVRLVEQGAADAGRKYMSQVAHVQRTSLERYPQSVLHLWSASQRQVVCQPKDEPCCMDAGLAFLARALALSRQEDEPAHVLRFDAGFRYAVALDFDTATPLFMAICKSASAPSKLRGLASVFLAATFLFVAQDERLGASAASSSDQEQTFSSVRLLLRSALRFLDDAKAKDAEAACLAQRVSCYLASTDSVLHLLPVEVLYVYCSSYASSPVVASRKPELARHKRALAYLDAFHVGGTSVAAMGLLQSRGKVIKLNASIRARSSSSRPSGVATEAQAICEWSVLRSSVLFHLGELTLAQQQLATLEALLPHVRATSFVPALVVFYDLQVWLRQRLVHAAEPVGAAEDSVPLSATLSTALRLLESGAFEYSHLYAGKLKALLAVWTKTCK